MRNVKKFEKQLRLLIEERDEATSLGDVEATEAAKLRSKIKGLKTKLDKADDELSEVNSRARRAERDRDEFESQVRFSSL